MLKKALFSVTAVLLFGAACLSYSCSVDYNEPQQIVKTSQEQTEEEILSIFIEFNKTLTPIPQSRATTRADWCGIVCSDVIAAANGVSAGAKIGSYFGPKGALIGMIAGGVIVGAAGSYLDYEERVERLDTLKVGQIHSDSYESKLYDQTIFDGYAIAETLINQEDYAIGNSLNFDSTSTKIGIMHNKVLDVVDKTSIETGSFISTDFDSLQIAIINHPEFIAAYQNVVNNTSYHKKSMCDRIIDSFCDAIKKSCDSTEDLHYIIEQYKLRVQSLATEGYTEILGICTDGRLVTQTTFLSIDQIQQMNAAFAVAAYSYDYWSTVYPYTVYPYVEQ